MQLVIRMKMDFNGLELVLSSEPVTFIEHGDSHNKAMLQANLAKDRVEMAGVGTVEAFVLFGNRERRVL